MTRITSISKHLYDYFRYLTQDYEGHDEVSLTKGNCEQLSSGAMSTTTAGLYEMLTACYAESKSRNDL